MEWITDISIRSVTVKLFKMTVPFQKASRLHVAIAVALAMWQWFSEVSMLPPLMKQYSQSDDGLDLVNKLKPKVRLHKQKALLLMQPRMGKEFIDFPSSAIVLCETFPIHCSQFSNCRDADLGECSGSKEVEKTCSLGGAPPTLLRHQPILWYSMCVRWYHRYNGELIFQGYMTY